MTQMKKIFSILLLSSLGIASVSAQTFSKGDNVASASVGVGGSYGVPVSLSYERGVYDINNKMAIGVGGLLGFGFDSEKFDGGKATSNHILLGARGAWHYTGFSSWDLYAGLTLGYNIVSSSVKYDNPLYSGEFDASSSGLLWGMHVGARYYFNEKFGVMGELGYGVGVLNLGVSYKF